MTGPGTNQYVLGEAEPILIDVAPYDAENARRLAPIGRPRAILLTHIHPDRAAVREDQRGPRAPRSPRAADPRRACRRRGDGPRAGRPALRGPAPGPALGSRANGTRPPRQAGGRWCGRRGTG